MYCEEESEILFHHRGEYCWYFYYDSPLNRHAMTRCLHIFSSWCLTILYPQNTCEEACFPFQELDAMLELNPQLVPSHTIYPCQSHGFSEYVETVTSGVEPDELTMDVYIKPIQTTKEKCCEGELHTQVL